MARGNKNPSPATRFKVGERANPIGKTGLQRELEIRNAQIATEIRNRFLERLKARAMHDTDLDAVIDRSNILALLKDSEERGLGTPKASLDISNEDGSLRNTSEELVIAALTRIHGPKP